MTAQGETVGSTEKHIFDNRSQNFFLLFAQLFLRPYKCVYFSTFHGANEILRCSCRFSVVSGIPVKKSPLDKFEIYASSFDESHVRKTAMCQMCLNQDVADHHRRVAYKPTNRKSYYLEAIISKTCDHFAERYQKMKHFADFLKLKPMSFGICA